MSHLRKHDPSMSARDDADTRPHHRTVRGLTLLLATLAGAAIGAAVALLSAPTDRPLFEARVSWPGDTPVAAEWPSEPGAAEAARLEWGAGGRELVVTAARAPRARALAAGLTARREADVRDLVARRDTLEVGWRVRMHLAPAPESSPGVECAALLFARARQQRDLALASPEAWGESRDVLPEPTPAVLQRLRDVDTASEHRDPAALLSAIAAEAREEDDWFASGLPTPSAAFPRRASLWRAWQMASADSFVARAQCVLDDEPEAALDTARANRELALVRIAVRTPPPFDGLLRSITAGPEPPATPILSEWRAWIGMGAALGGLLAMLAAFLGFALRRAARRAPSLFVPERDPGAPGTWLHVVAGPNSVAVARACLELSAHALARGERVLVVDGGPRLRLHERFGREARWGLMECLIADMPIIGLVQYGGRPGFYLLAHGLAGRGEGWAALGQRLDGARPHFGRVVLALDLSAPRSIGDALAGRTLEAWWAAATDELPKAAHDLSGRIGIAFSGINLSGMSEVTLEALSARSKVLASLPQAAPDPRPVAEIVLEPAYVEPQPELPLVLDCDLQVRQRLRFLAWMRRVQSERRRIEARSAS